MEFQAAKARLAEAKKATDEGRIADAKPLQIEADTKAAAAEGFLRTMYAKFLEKPHADEARFCNGLIKNFSGWQQAYQCHRRPERASANGAACTEGQSQHAAQIHPRRKPTLQTPRRRCGPGRMNSRTPRPISGTVRSSICTNKLATIVPAAPTKKPGANASARETLDPHRARCGAPEEARRIEEDPIHGESLKQITAMKAAIQSDADAEQLERRANSRSSS